MPDYLIPILALAAFFCSAFFALALLSLASGWRRLAETYPLEGDGAMEDLPPALVSMGRPLLPLRYNSCVRLSAGPSGLALSIVFPFRFFHPPILLPWAAIASCERGRSWSRATVTLTLREFPTRITLAGRAAETVYGYWSTGAKP